MEAKILQEILDCAVQAPSGDNTQPWRFKKVGDNAVDIIAWSEKDNPIFNYKNIPTLIAIGTVLENISNIFPEYGYEVEIDYSDTVKNNSLKANDVAARITFRKSDKASSSSIGKILGRHTNRNAYSGAVLSPESMNKILSLEVDEGVLVKGVFDRSGIESIAVSVTESERTVLSHKRLHDSFFHSIRWNTPNDNEETRGLDIKTLELIGPAKVLFKLHSNWFFATILNKIGIINVIAKENANVYKTSSGYLVFSAKNYSQENALNLGRTLQRYWVYLCSEGFGVQLNSGISFLYPQLNVKDGAISDLDLVQKNRIDEAHKNILKVSHSPKENDFALFMRFGYPKMEATIFSKKNKAMVE